MRIIKIIYKNKKGDNMLNVYDFNKVDYQVRNETTGYNHGSNLEDKRVVLLMFHQALRGLTEIGIINEIKVI